MRVKVLHAPFDQYAQRLLDGAGIAALGIDRRDHAARGWRDRFASRVPRVPASAGVRLCLAPYFWATDLGFLLYGFWDWWTHVECLMRPCVTVLPLTVA